MNYKNISWVVVSLFIMCSCEKHDEQNYEISYHDLVPDEIITSVRDSGYLEWGEFDGPCYFPVPKDSTANYRIDLNGDGILDFEFEHFHGFPYDWAGGCGSSPHWYCHCFVYRSYISALDSISSIIIDTNSANFIKLYEVGDTIYSNSVSEQLSLIYLYTRELCQGCYLFTNGIYYVGVKMFSPQKSNIGWIQLEVNRNKLIIKEYAYVNERNKFIIAGKKE